VAAVQYTITQKQYTGSNKVAAVQNKLTHKHYTVLLLVAAVQYTFTHKQYTEYSERNIHNYHKIEHT
jgi:hypothetical protein